MLTIMCGLPGSGKSTYLRESTETAKSIILCPDDFRLAITGQQYYGPAEDMVWSHVKITARVLLKRGYDVIIDGTHLTRGSRGSWIRIAKEIGVDVACCWKRVTPDVAKQRNKGRSEGQVVPEREMNRMIGSFLEPSVYEGFSSVDIVET